MDEAQRIAFDGGRDLAGKACRSFCYAPFTSMYLDPRGDVLACCQNTEQVLGNVAATPLLEIWRGRPTADLRAALTDYDLSRGCRFCAWQVDDGNLGATYSHSFEDLSVDQPVPDWPRRLELAISNTCNLECVMCNGEWSSKIRSRREGRPPLPRVYTDRFFADLEAFLPHLDEIRFLGGEPLLAAESLRVMEMVIEGGHSIRCHLTTNGTQWNPRVERILERLPVSLAVSLDGVSREVIEEIRVGASYDVLMANLDRYLAHTRANGTQLDLTFCLMRPNWQEFGDYLRFADDLGARVYINTVIHPQLGLYHLPLAQFDEVVRALERQDSAMRATLGQNRDVWTSELDRLRRWSARAHAESSGTAIAEPYRPITPRAVYFRQQEAASLPASLRAAGRPEGVLTEERAAAVAAQGMPEPETALVWCDPEDLVTRVRSASGESFMGVPSSQCVGQPFPELVGQLARLHGEEIDTRRDEVVDGAAIRHVVFRRGDGAATYLQVCSYPQHHAGQLVGSVTAAAWSPHAPDWALAAAE